MMLLLINLEEKMFLVGQRWLSESENNLGLGIVTSVDHRTVTINFPAAEEERVYAIAVAPLTRVQFQAGDRINSIDGWQLEVSEVVENQGAVIYLGKGWITVKKRYCLKCCSIIKSVSANRKTAFFGSD